MEEEKDRVELLPYSYSPCVNNPDMQVLTPKKGFFGDFNRTLTRIFEAIDELEEIIERLKTMFPLEFNSYREKNEV